MNIKKDEIVLVEDNQYDVELILRAFKKNNLNQNIIVLEDGEEALDYFFAKGKYIDRNKKINPKFILLDLKLPKLDGLDVLKELKSNDTIKSIPIIVLTSSKEEKDICESYKLGVNSYIVKPVEFEKFVEVIGKVGLYWFYLNESIIR